MYFVFFSVFFNFFSISLGKYFSFFHPGNTHFLDCKQNVSAGINTWMSISDGLKLSIFCRNMEKARPMRKEKIGKVVDFPPGSEFLNLMLYFKITFPFLYLDLACKQACFLPEKVVNVRNESTKTEK